MSSLELQAAPISGSNYGIGFDKSGDMPLSEFPITIIPRVVSEWARIDSSFPMKLYNHELLGTHVTLGNDRWYIGRDDKQAEAVLQVTQDVGAYGGARGERSWRVSVKDLIARGLGAMLRQK